MIYLVGGAPRAGKSILGQQLAAKLNAGWISTDILMTLLSTKKEEGAKTEWNADPEAITANATWFFPYLERFIWGVTSMAEQYVIEGVDFLPAQVAQLAPQYQIRSVFLGCSNMTLDRFERFPGCSPGYIWPARGDATPDRSGCTPMERLHSAGMRTLRLSLYRYSQRFSRTPA